MGGAFIFFKQLLFCWLRILGMSFRHFVYKMKSTATGNHWNANDIDWLSEQGKKMCVALSKVGSDRVESIF